MCVRLLEFSHVIGVLLNFPIVFLFVLQVEYFYCYVFEFTGACVSLQCCHSNHWDGIFLNLKVTLGPLVFYLLSPCIFAFFNSMSIVTIFFQLFWDSCHSWSIYIVELMLRWSPSSPAAGQSGKPLGRREVLRTCNFTREWGKPRIQVL